MRIFLKIGFCLQKQQNTYINTPNYFDAGILKTLVLSLRWEISFDVFTDGIMVIRRS